MKKKVILCPNPYRDSELKVAKDAKAILEGIGFETVVCLPFHRDGYGDELGVPVRQLQQMVPQQPELRSRSSPPALLDFLRCSVFRSMLHSAS